MALYVTSETPLLFASTLNTRCGLAVTITDLRARERGFETKLHIILFPLVKWCLYLCRDAQIGGIERKGEEQQAGIVQRGAGFCSNPTFFTLFYVDISIKYIKT